MSEQDLFESVLAELAVLMRRLDCIHDAVLIGGQVVAVERLAAGHQAVFQVETDTGHRIDRPYSMEPDLLIDPPSLEESARWDELPKTLRNCGYRRTGRTFRWAKELDGQTMQLDLFMSDTHGEPATEMTRLEDGDLVFRRAREVAVSVKGAELRIKLPHPADFIRMKLDNLDRSDVVRTEAHKAKDALDIFAYIRLKTPAMVAKALSGPRDRHTLARLQEHFGAEHAAGVQRVLAMVPGLPEDQRRLIAKDVVRVVRATSRSRGPSR